MDTADPTVSTNFLHRLWLDSLHHLFRCGSCDASIVAPLAFALTRPGGLVNVSCPDCDQVWAFVRLPQSVYDQPQLTHEEIVAANQAIDEQARAHLRDRRSAFWAATQRMFRPNLDLEH